MINWHLKSFDELKLQELYAFMHLRQEVFILEQKCAFIDADGKDQKCHHLSGFLNEDLVAYARIVPPGLSYAEPSIGRIVTAPEYRRKGIGKQLMEVAINAVYQLYGLKPTRIEAQLYLKTFYEGYGFIAEGEPYILDDILHVIMIRIA